MPWPEGSSFSPPGAVGDRLLHAPVRTRSHTRAALVGPELLLLGSPAFAPLLAEGAGYDGGAPCIPRLARASKTVAVWAFGAFSVTMRPQSARSADRLVARFGPGSLRRESPRCGCGCVRPERTDGDRGLGPVRRRARGSHSPVLHGGWKNVEAGANHGTHVARAAGLGYVGRLAALP